MAFARRYPRNWWLPVTPIFLLLAAVFIGVGPYLLAGGIHKPSSPQLRQDVATLERAEGIDTPVDVEKVSNFTKEANAFSVGLGPTERVVVWDTLLDGRFSDEEVRVVLAHEFGHIAPAISGRGSGGRSCSGSRSRSCSPASRRGAAGSGIPGFCPTACSSCSC